MIKKEGALQIHEQRSNMEDLIGAVENLPDGDYKYVIIDNTKNPLLPQLKYLCGIVLKTISDTLPDHPPIDALYRYFEEKFAPRHTVKIDGEDYEYVDLKNEKATEMDNVIKAIVHLAQSRWGINVPERSSLKVPEAKELFKDAYLEMWKRKLNNPNIITHD